MPPLARKEGQASNEPLLEKAAADDEAEDKPISCLQRHIPLLKWGAEYERYMFTKDITTGLTLGLMCLSQTLAQAAIAGVTPINGPYTSFMPPIIYFFLGTSKHCSISSGSMGSLLVNAALNNMDPDMPLWKRTELALVMSVISGVVMILMGVLNLAFAVRFLSQATISGFVSGSAFLIIASQLKTFFGYTTIPGPLGPGAEFKFLAAVMNIANCNKVNLGLCVAFMVILDFFKKLKGKAKKKTLDAAKAIKDGDEDAKVKARKSAKIWKVIGKITEVKEVIVIILGISFSFAANQLHYCQETSQNVTISGECLPIIPIVGDLPRGLPPFDVSFMYGNSTMELLHGPPAVLQNFILSSAMVAFTSFLTTYASNKKLALAYKYEIDGSQELFALGGAMLGGAFFGAFPICGSLSRSGLAGQLGCYSQVFGLVVVAIIALSLLFLAPVLKWLPKCALAAIVITSAIGLIDFKTPKEIWNSSPTVFKEGLRKDFIVWCVGFFCTIQLGALQGICIAVAVGVVQVVAEATTPKASTLGAVKELGGRYDDIEEFPDAITTPGLLVFEIRGPLCFCSAEGFHEELMCRMKKSVKAIVLDFSTVEYMDYTALSVLKDVLDHFTHDKKHYMIAGAKANVVHLLREKLGPWNEEQKSGMKKLPLITEQTMPGCSVEEAAELLEDKLKNPDEDHLHEHLEHLRQSSLMHFDEVHHTHLADH